MTRADFLEHIYSQIRPGMTIRKPKTVSKIISISKTGSIHYSIGTKSKKAVTRNDLCAIFDALVTGNLTNQTIREISRTSRPCNVTTIKCLLKELNLATEDPNGTWNKSW